LPSGSLSTSASAEISIDAEWGLAEILEDSLLPEVERPASERSRVDVEALNGRLVIRIDASDVAALRAAVNSYLRWVSAVQDVVEKIR
jgi:tRNA threonylcarbamoyladenosine modification (KEOPS) complex  Pcc1 subunit